MDEIRLPNGLVPMSDGELGNVNYSAAVLSVGIKNLSQKTTLLGKSAGDLNMRDARRIDCAIQVQNIQKSADSISMYLGMAIMLLDNIKADLETIYAARKQFSEDYTKRMEAVENAKRQQKHRDAQKEEESEETK